MDSAASEGAKSDKVILWLGFAPSREPPESFGKSIRPSGPAILRRAGVRPFVGSMLLTRRDFLKATMASAVPFSWLLASARSTMAQTNSPKFDRADIRALVFDVFGTTVDWRGSITRELNELAKRKGFRLDAAKFADAWRAGYQPAMQRVREGSIPWTKLDGLHRMILDQIVKDFGLTGLPESERDQLNRAWHRLQPWPDVVSGLTRLKKKFILAPLSNGNVSLMTDMARQASLPWDCILGAELVRHYKPDPEVYQSAYELLDLKPAQVMMVAAHLTDLTAAKAGGLMTAFVLRPQEFGPDGKPDLQPNNSVDLIAKDFGDLANRLGA